MGICEHSNARVYQKAKSIRVQFREILIEQDFQQVLHTLRGIAPENKRNSTTVQIAHLAHITGNE